MGFVTAKCIFSAQNCAMHSIIPHIPNPKLPYTVVTDASGIAVGGHWCRIIEMGFNHHWHFQVENWSPVNRDILHMRENWPLLHIVSSTGGTILRDVQEASRSLQIINRWQISWISSTSPDLRYDWSSWDCFNPSTQLSNFSRGRRIWLLIHYLGQLIWWLGDQEFSQKRFNNGVKLNVRIQYFRNTDSMNSRWTEKQVSNFLIRIIISPTEKLTGNSSTDVIATTYD